MAFPGPVGLAAGFDRDARRLDEIRGWGFGFVELGTVTPLAVPDHNPGVAALAAVLARNTILERAIGERPVIGISLGVQPDSAIEHAWRDTLRGMRALWSSADYLALNFTSANAQGLHGPERRYTLLALLARAKEEQERVTAASGRHVPLLIKWPVGPGSDDAVSIAQRIRGFGYDGMIAAFESDSPVDPAWEGWVPSACRGLAQTLGPRMTLIAVGGIDRVRRALDLRDAGARLVQIYRGFETHGSPLVQAIAGAWTVREGAATAPA
jgi:dihydroorotate dehydrogenase